MIRRTQSWRCCHYSYQSGGRAKRTFAAFLASPLPVGGLAPESPRHLAGNHGLAPEGLTCM
jgi:hypothetical protein